MVFDLLMTFLNDVFSFLVSHTWSALKDKAELPFYAGKMDSLIYLKITTPWKRRDIGLVWELLAPDYGYTFGRHVTVCWKKVSVNQRVYLHCARAKSGHEWRRRRRVGGLSEACGLVDRLKRTLVPRILSLAFLRHEREPWEQGWLLARLLEYKVVNYDAIELVAAINRFVVY